MKVVVVADASLNVGRKVQCDSMLAQHLAMLGEILCTDPKLFVKKRHTLPFKVWGGVHSVDKTSDISCQAL